jgi:YfiH family protein
MVTHRVHLSDSTGGSRRDSVRLPWLSLAPPAWISLKAAGDLSLSQRTARTRFLERHRVPPRRVFALKQIHSQDVFLTADLERRVGIPGDGLVTTDPQAVLTVTVADCLPIFLYDRRLGACGLCHSGWKGTGIVTRAVELMENRIGSRPSDILALIGPGIGACCYAVPESRYHLFRGYGQGAAAVRAGEFFIDLRRANLSLLAAAGVGETWVVEDCTRCHPELSSFRGQGQEGYVGMMAVFGPKERND